MALLIGQTNNANENAIFGRNDATSAPSGGGGVQGSGVFGLSVSPGTAGVFGAQNSNKGVGVQGNGPEAGISGFSDSGAGVRAHSNHANAVEGFAHDPNGNAILAINEATTPSTAGGAPRGNGILAVTTVPGAAGVFGANNSAKGVGVQGNGPQVGVRGFSDQGSGMTGQSNKGSGMVSTSDRGQGMSVFSNNDVAIFAQGATFSGVFNGALVVNKGPNPSDPSIQPSNINGSIVINDGNLFLNKGDIILAGADCVEDFGVCELRQVEPGTVMVLDREGELCECSAAYDKRVAGVISGAGSYKPGLVLDRHLGEEGRVPLALVGKVYCKVDAEYGQIEIGDLLTTSPTAGHAMRAADPANAFGAVIGKALRPLRAGRGLVPILVALQ